MNSISLKRNPFWDSLKVLLIFFVVYGHMIETCVENSKLNQALYNTIYLFHMPLFVFVSGYFSHMKNKKKYLTRMGTIFETYIVFQFIRCIKPMFTEGNMSLFPDILFPKGILWYLACLLLWRAIIVLFNEQRLKYYKTSILTFFIISGIGIGFFSINGTISRFLILGFYFFLGYYFKGQYISYLKRIPLLASIICILCLFTLVYLKLNTDIRSIIHFESYFSKPTISPFILLFSRICVYIFALVFGCLVMRLVLAKKILASWGDCTLAIFMFHTFIIIPLRPLLTNNVLPNNEFMLFIYAIIILFTLAYMAHHFIIITIILNPISYILKKIKYYYP